MTGPFKRFDYQLRRMHRLEPGRDGYAVRPSYEAQLAARGFLKFLAANLYPPTHVTALPSGAIRFDFRQGPRTASVTWAGDGTGRVAAEYGSDAPAEARACGADGPGYETAFAYLVYHFQKAEPEPAPEPRAASGTGPEPKSATVLLSRGLEIIQARAREYDRAGGERSAAAVAAAFNGVKGRAVLTETDVWVLLALLKLVRLDTAPGPHDDSAVDAAVYAALAGESKYTVR